MTTVEKYHQMRRFYVETRERYMDTRRRYEETCRRLTKAQAETRQAKRAAEIEIEFAREQGQQWRHLYEATLARNIVLCRKLRDAGLR